MNVSDKLKTAARDLSRAVSGLTFSSPTAVVYNPLEYAWDCHSLFLEKYGNTTKRVVFLGMNPGPWGMVQTGVPFGEIGAVREWLRIEAPVGKPPDEHPKRPVEGFRCSRSEVSGRRLWGLFKERFQTPDRFFREHFVANYCPLVFMEESSRNRTPDKLKADERQQLFAICDDHLREVVQVLEPEWLVGVGRFTRERAQQALEGMDVRVGQVLHPSPASPAANRDWAGTVTTQLTDLKIWA